MRIKVGNRELKVVDGFKCLGIVLTRDAYSTRTIKLRIAMAKEAFNLKIRVKTSKLNIEPRNNFVGCYVWSIALYDSETWTLRKLKQKYFESFEMWC